MIPLISRVYGSPLHVACMKGNLSLVRTLIRDYHADLNDKDSYGNMVPFTLALKYERDEVMLVLISEFGYDPTNIKVEDGVSRALHVASKKGNLSLVRISLVLTQVPSLCSQVRCVARIYHRGCLLSHAHFPTNHTFLINNAH